MNQTIELHKKCLTLVKKLPDNSEVKKIAQELLAYFAARRQFMHVQNELVDAEDATPHIEEIVDEDTNYREYVQEARGTNKEDE